jgi:Family of unknown function (DUF6266)
MGRLVNGINGPFVGKVGSVIGSSWKGVPYMKGVYKQRTGKASPGEQANRNKFRLAQSWLAPTVNFVREGFRNYSPRVEGFLAAKSWLLLHSFEGIPPDISINPALVKLSHGTLPLSSDLRVELIEDSHIKFSWNPEKIPDGNVKDQAMLLAYDIYHSYVTYQLTGQFRETGTDILQLPPIKNRTYHIYFAFVADDRSRQSDSAYLGIINI